MKLYKFNGYPDISPNDPPPPDFSMRPWWTASLPYKHDGGVSKRNKALEASGSKNLPGGGTQVYIPNRNSVT